MLGAIGQSEGGAGQGQPTVRSNELSGFYVAAVVMHSTLRMSMSAEQTYRLSRSLDCLVIRVRSSRISAPRARRSRTSESRPGGLGRSKGDYVMVGAGVTRTGPKGYGCSWPQHIAKTCTLRASCSHPLGAPSTQLNISGLPRIS